MTASSSATTVAPTDHPWAQPADAVAAALGTDASTGLSAAEAARLLAEHGPNELPSKPPVPAWKRFLAQFNDPLVFLLLGAIVISAIAWVLEGAHGVPVDSLVILAVVTLNAVLGFVQESKAADAVAALSEMTKATSTVLRDGARLVVPSSELVVGDILILGEGDQVGADARLLSAAALRVVESSLTGEADAITKSSDPVAADADLADRTGMVYRGTSVAQGTGKAIVVATGGDTEMGAIARMLDAVEEEPTPLQEEIHQISKMLGIIVVVIAVVVVGTLLILADDRSAETVIHALLLGVSLAVAAVPEGLPAILSVVLALGVQRMALHKAVVKKLTSVETLGSASVICSDKTGTLTRSEMTIQEVVTASGTAVVTGIGYAPDGQVSPDADRDGQPDADPLEGALADEVMVVLSGGTLASDAELSVTDEVWSVVGDPTEGAFLVAEKKLGTDGHREGRFERVGEVPFTSDRKMMSVLHTDTKHGMIIISKGAPDVLMEHCAQVRIDGGAQPLTDEIRQRFTDHIADMSGRALRTLGVAYRVLDEAEAARVRAAGQGDADFSDMERDLVMAGVVGIIDPPRPEAATAVAEAHRAGVRVLMITGDHPATAGRIAADLGIAERGAPVLTGRELTVMDDEALREAVAGTSVYARVAPEHKMRIVDALKSQGHTVSMTGDGVNDAPALRAADIGVAMGITGTQVTKEAATMVLADDNFATIVDAVREGRRIFDNIKKFLRFLLSSNMGEVLTVFCGVVLAGVIGLSDHSETGVVLPLVATQILWINLVTDSGPALAMGVDPSVEDVMGRPPRKPTDRVVDGAMWAGVLLVGAVMAFSTLATLDIFLPGGLIEVGVSTDDLATARTAAFTTLVFAQLFNTLNSRSETVSAFRHLFVNKWLWGSIALAIVLQVAVVEIPLLQTAFSTAPLDLTHWMVVVAMASLVLWVDEIRKLIMRARG
ncbi:cation-translocating P-type ATPase [Actinomyces bowdenii]|uniref:Cation-translocating P-type ATPase n=1 Tax=Actinomyces bowdenii TaxID=131109 RepID=A0A3P1V7C4_9ACTO|nr:cation-translocating P-type ATPase [Actinomyces bowdenii]MBO3725022.1 cation-translocating P-type ATPase [Actinomyces bowdenii]RRD30092.1 cation-translocating P-type ATPase [Actinomyces bowdenii]